MKPVIVVIVSALLLCSHDDMSAQEKAPDSLKVRRAQQSFLKNQGQARVLLEKKIAEVRQEYLAELEELGDDFRTVLEAEQKDATKDGELEEALKIKQIAEDFERSMKREQDALSGASVSNSLTALESQLEGTKWKLSGGQRIYFDKNGEGGFLTDQRKFQWGAFSHNQVIVRYLKSNYVDIYQFEIDEKKCTVRKVGFVGQITGSGTPITSP
ncbi:MAG: hypothetical protein HUJ26_06220 [Planctomycetaceae bacterium]|nr:hypothetical protein [Planctomycetaceae bacterium]